MSKNDLESIIRNYENSPLGRAERLFKEVENKIDVKSSFDIYYKGDSKLERINQFHDSIFKFQSILPNHFEEESTLYKIKNRTSNFKESVEYIISEAPENLQKLAMQGWYINFSKEFRLAVSLSDKIEEDSFDELDSFFINHYRTNLENIFGQLKTRHPKRVQILDELKESYHKGLYNTCIPTIFSQIDGICKDVISKGFFNKINKKSEYKHLPVIIENLESVKDGLLKAFLFPIYNNTPAIAHESTLGNFSVKLNRHSIMHGEDTEYGTEINCLRCISLLIYISDVLESTQLELSK